MRAAALLLFLVVAAPAAARGQTRDDWASTPEGSFLTREERQAWKRLTSDSAREEFKRAYWRRRDPTPDTERNEFQDEILARIRTADEKFGSGGQPGSRTARGGVYVLFGPPAISRTTTTPLDTTPRSDFPGSATLPRTALDGTVWEEWIYTREHNAELLEIVGRPVVEIAFVIDRGRDQVQKPGLLAAYRDAVARKSGAK